MVIAAHAPDTEMEAKYVTALMADIEKATLVCLVCRKCTPRFSQEAFPTEAPEAQWTECQERWGR